MNLLIECNVKFTKISLEGGIIKKRKVTKSEVDKTWIEFDAVWHQQSIWRFKITN